MYIYIRKICLILYIYTYYDVLHFIYSSKKTTLLDAYKYIIYEIY